MLKLLYFDICRSDLDYRHNFILGKHQHKHRNPRKYLHTKMASQSYNVVHKLMYNYLQSKNLYKLIYKFSKHLYLQIVLLGTKKRKYMILFIQSKPILTGKQKRKFGFYCQQTVPQSNEIHNSMLDCQHRNRELLRKKIRNDSLYYLQKVQIAHS